MTVGFRQGEAFDATRTDWSGDAPRPLRWSMWYPSDPAVPETAERTESWFALGPNARDAPMRALPAPPGLALLSHGTGGVSRGLDWLARRLAEAGMIALAVDHHGNCGSEPYRAEGFLCLWERARDLSALLDAALWRSELGTEIAPGVLAAGFSAGAYAATLLIGGRVAFSQFEPDNPELSQIRGPREFPDLADRIPDLLATSAPFRAAWARRRDDHRDPRIRAALALAPGRSVRGLSPESLRGATGPLRIVVGDADRVAPPETCAVWLRDRVPGATLELARGGADHQVFLPPPSAKGLREAPDLFRDPPGVDRDAIHARAAAEALRLLRGG